jgi:uncharacterized protein with HEPN domain
VKDQALYLIHILESAVRIEEYTRLGKEAFDHSPMAQDAVIRKLEIIGEAAKRVDQWFRDAHPDVPWRRMAGLRDV